MKTLKITVQLIYKITTFFLDVFESIYKYFFEGFVIILKYFFAKNSNMYFKYFSK